MKTYRSPDQFRLVGKGWEIRHTLRNWMKEASASASSAPRVGGASVVPLHPTLQQWLRSTPAHKRNV